MTIDFSKLAPDVRDVPAPPGSVNAELLALPQQREHTHDVKGKLLYFPRSDQVMVPYQYADGGWNVVVIHNGPRAPRRTNGSGAFVYTPGGHNLYVSDLELQTAIELTPSDRFFLTVFVRGDLEHDVDMTPPPWSEDYSLDGVRALGARNLAEGHAVEIRHSIEFGAEPWEVSA